MPGVPIKLSVTVTTGEALVPKTVARVTNRLRHALKWIDPAARIAFDPSDLIDLPATNTKPRLAAPKRRG
jgi:hypothetical protein